MEVTNFQKVTIEERLKSPSNSYNILEIRNLDVIFRRGFHTNHAVKNVSFNVKKGEIFGLVGESGSGKTTIGRAIAGLVDFVNGSINVNGIKIPNKKNRVVGSVRKKLIKNVQMIFQDPASSLNPYKSVRKIVSEGLDNIDVKKLYQTKFDNQTIAMLYKIIAPKDYPQVLKDNNLSHFVVLANNDPKKFFKIVYGDIYDAMKNDHYLKTYIEFRKEIRDQAITNVKSNKIIKSNLIREVVESVGISETMLNRYPLEFSGGQQQRVGIARSVVMQPAIIVADEPISALDVSIQAQVINIFNDLKDKLNLTFLFIAHDLRMVEYISDRIAVINEGTMVEIGDANEIVNNPLHPYTKSLIGSIPTIDLINESLRSIPYDPAMHGYNKDNKPSWFRKLGTKKEHYVYGTAKEVQKWAREVKNDK